MTLEEIQPGLPSEPRKHKELGIDMGQYMQNAPANATNPFSYDYEWWANRGKRCRSQPGRQSGGWRSTRIVSIPRITGCGSRPVYGSATIGRAALPADVDEWLFLQGDLTNLLLRCRRRLVTPSTGSGLLLPGVLRESLLISGTSEEVLRAEDLACGEVLVGNSRRGTAPARLVT